MILPLTPLFQCLLRLSLRANLPRHAARAMRARAALSFSTIFTLSCGRTQERFDLCE